MCYYDLAISSSRLSNLSCKLLDHYLLSACMVSIFSRARFAALQTNRCSLINEKVTSEFSAIRRPAALSYCHDHACYSPPRQTQE